MLRAIDPNPTADYAHPAGRFGFDRDMGATKAMLEVETPGGSGDAVQLTARALTEVKLRFYEPFRRLKIWRQVPPNVTLIVGVAPGSAGEMCQAWLGWLQHQGAIQCMDKAVKQPVSARPKK